MTGSLELIIFDMDGVLIDVNSSWAWVHEYFGIDNQESVEAYKKGHIDDHEFIKRDINLWKKQKNDISRNDIAEILKKAPVMKGFQECILKLSKDYKLAIISGGLKPLAKHIGREYFDKIMANDVVEKDGVLTGDANIEVGLNEKGKVFDELLDVLDVDKRKTAAVGNSQIDIPMLDKASKGIAFNPEDEKVKECADVVIEEKDLELLLSII